MSETTAPDTVTTWLTPSTHARLSAELEELTGPMRADISRRIGEAREEGDLKENGGYHAAKEEQGKQEARIRQLTDLLRHAAAGAPPANGTANWLSVVTVRFDGDSDTESFVLGCREEHLEGREVYSPESVIGSAVMGHAAGDHVSYQAPNGKTLGLTVVGVEPLPA